MWALESVETYPVRQTNPGANVTHANGDATVARLNAESEFVVKFRDHGDEQTMDHALINSLYEILGPFTINLKDEARTLGTPTFLQIKALAALKWGHSTPS